MSSQAKLSAKRRGKQSVMEREAASEPAPDPQRKENEAPSKPHGEDSREESTDPAAPESSKSQTATQDRGDTQAINNQTEVIEALLRRIEQLESVSAAPAPKASRPAERGKTDGQVHRKPPGNPEEDPSSSGEDTSPPPRNATPSPSSSEDQSKSTDDDLDLVKFIKFNHDKLSARFTRAKWDSWMEELGMIFDSSRKHFRSARAKILYACSQMDHDIKQQYRLKKSFGSEEEANLLQKDWETYRKWTKSVIRKAANEEAMVAAQLERAQQRPGQDPAQFHQYLASLEAQTDRRTDKQQAMFFYGKFCLNAETIWLTLLPDDGRYFRGPNEKENHSGKPYDYTSKRRRDDTDTHDAGRHHKRRKDQDLRHRGDRKSRENKKSGERRPRGGRKPSENPPDLSDITCYRCQKKGHYANSCTEPAPVQRTVGKGRKS
ncbi:uncharacterized protein PG986_014565 [Apiospora aurea]|uniref:CCHC-type domain-containing protein n=1 Tax=Apiospora aurea TaxID=335848 RepID=A0ABR1PTC6_9PEZI